MRDELQDRLSESIARHKVPGAAVAVWDDGQRYEAVAGVVNQNTRVPVTPDTIFHVGSITKACTATLVMQLVDAGMLRLDQPVRSALPEFRPADAGAAATITVRHLLCHVCGLDGDLMDDVSRDADAVERLIARLPRVGQLHPPGRLFSYCNLGYVVLGRMLEVLARKTWDDLLRERILGPLGMQHSVTRPEHALRFRTSVGHWTNARTGEPEVSKSRFSPRSNSPAGTMLAGTPGDLVRFARAHLEGDHLLPGTRRREMQRLQVETPLAMRYSGWALGWMRFDFGGVGMFGHDGGGDGTNAFLRIVPGERFIVALTANNGRAGGVFKDVVVPLLKARCGIELPDLAAAQVLHNPQPDVVGRYARHGQQVEVTQRGNRLHAVWSGEYVGDEPEAFELEPLRTDLYRARLRDAPAPLGLYFLEFDGQSRPKYLHLTERAFRRTGVSDA